MKQFIKKYLLEFAKPTLNQTNNIWYHGFSKKYLKPILSSGKLKGSVTTDDSKGLISMNNKVYLTKQIENGIGYAFFRNNNHFLYPSDKLKWGSQPFAYMAIVKGEALYDIYPDEDAVADLIDNSDWLQELAEKYTPELWHVYNYGDWDNDIGTGEYSTGAEIGKELIKYHLDDEDMLELINLHNMNLSNQGDVEIHQIWQIDMNERDNIKANIKNWKKYSKLIKQY